MRFFATGDLQQPLSFSYRIGKATASKIISEICQNIFTVLKESYLAPPSTEAEWLKMSKHIEEVWNTPHEIGCINVKQRRATIENMEKYTVAYLALNNDLRLTGNAHYILSCFGDSEDKYDNLLPSDWNVLNGNGCCVLVSLPHVRGSPSQQDALEARSKLKIFLNSDQGSLS